MCVPFRPSQTIVSGAPFLFGAGSVILALLLALFIPENYGHSSGPRSPVRRTEYVLTKDYEPSGSESLGSSADQAPLLVDVSH